MGAGGIAHLNRDMLWRQDRGHQIAHLYVDRLLVTRKVWLSGSYRT